MHEAAYQYVAREAVGLALAGARVLEVGAYNVNGSVRDLFPGTCYVGLDRRAGRGVDVACDVRDYCQAEPCDVIVCCEVLEHDPAPQEIIAAAERLLAPGGVLILTAAGVARIPHGCNGGDVPTHEHYRNISDTDLANWLCGWRSWRITWSRDRMDIYATAVRA